MTPARVLTEEVDSYQSKGRIDSVSSSDALSPDTTISVLIPILNGSGIFERAVASVLQQTGARIELLLLDDGSTDSSPAVEQSLAAADARIRLSASLLTVGLAQTLGRGLRESVGEFVLVLHQDCRLRGEDWIRRAVTEITRTGAGAVVGTPWFDTAGMHRAELRAWVIKGKLPVERSHGSRPPQRLFSENKCDLFSRRALETAGGFDLSARWGGEDQILAEAFQRRGISVAAPAGLEFELSLGKASTAGRVLRKEYDYGRQMQFVLTRMGRRVVRRSADGSLDPRVIDRTLAVLWPAAALTGAVISELWGVHWWSLVLFAPVAIRVAQLLSRSLAGYRPLGLTWRDLVSILGMGLSMDVLYLAGLALPHRAAGTPAAQSDHPRG